MTAPQTPEQKSRLALLLERVIEGRMPAATPQEWDLHQRGDGTERPEELPQGDAHLYVTRTFVFADLSGFTAFTRVMGPDAAVARLGEFRRITRNIAAKRGVRVAKWLGDGAMLIGTEAGPAVAFAANLLHRFEDSDIKVRVGLATGTALMFEGDDYIGEPVNLAAKLCNAAGPGELLADVNSDAIPEWVQEVEKVEVDIRGIGLVGGISMLRPALG